MKYLGEFESEYEIASLHHAQARERKIRERAAEKVMGAEIEPVKARGAGRPDYLPRSRKARRALRMKRAL